MGIILYKEVIFMSEEKQKTWDKAIGVLTTEAGTGIYAYSNGNCVMFELDLDDEESKELQEKIEKVRKHCYFSYYMFAPDVSEDVRRDCMSHAMQHNEMPIDLQSIELLNIADEDKEIMVMSNAAYTRLVLIDAAHTDKYSEFCNKILANYVAKYRDNIVFVRGFND